MRCPYCAHEETAVKDSRATEDGGAIRRRRVCPECGGRFTTFERVQLREMMVVKRSGRRSLFERDKLYRSIELATRKRNIEPEKIEKLVSSIVRQLEALGEPEISTETIGQAVMKSLKSLDDVAYVRFASVYHNFAKADDFKEFLGELNDE